MSSTIPLLPPSNWFSIPRFFDEEYRLREKQPYYYVLPNGEASFATFRPIVDVTQTPTEVIVEVELPGLKKEDINLEVKDGVLYLYGERSDEKSDHTTRWVKSEIEYATFGRNIPVPKNVDPTSATAQYQHGLLTVRLPLAKQQTTAKAISIN